MLDWLSGKVACSSYYTLCKIVRKNYVEGEHDWFNWRPGIKLDNNWRCGAPQGRHGPLHFSVIRRHPSMMR